MASAFSGAAARAVMRAVTSPGPQYSARVGLPEWNRSESRVSTLDSPSPKIFRNRERITCPDRACR